ncbi:unnamed protein product [Meloidogyne enterolobii]|uniref:Uncharacterized protein n=1 Tax=Meloidogyne enterolobii TaxID=390850 RepID=A0ACB0YB41_MELEN
MERWKEVVGVVHRPGSSEKFFREKAKWNTQKGGIKRNTLIKSQIPRRSGTGTGKRDRAVGQGKGTRVG